MKSRFFLAAIAALLVAPVLADTVCYFDGSTYIDTWKRFPVKGSVSLSAWVRVDPKITTLKPKGGNVYGAGIVGQGYIGGTTGLGIFANDGVKDDDTSNDGIAWMVRGGPGTQIDGTYADPTLFTAGEWHHYLLVRDKENGKVRFYVDGSLCGEKNFASSEDITPQFDFGIGKNLTGFGECFCGWIADVALWNVALTAEDAALLLTVGAQGIAGKPPYAYFPLDEGSGNSVTGTDNGTSFTCSASGALSWMSDSSFYRVTTGDRFTVSTAPFGVGSPMPSGARTGLVAGQSFSVSCGATPLTNATGTAYYACNGWKLYDKDGTEVSNGTETAFTYVHPNPVECRMLEWQWEERATAYGKLAKAAITKLTPKSDGAEISWGVSDCGIGSSSVDIYLDYAETADFSNATTVQLGDDIGADLPATGSYTFSGLSSGQVRYVRLRLENDGGHTTITTPDAFMARGTGTYTWTGGGVAGKWDDKDNWDGMDYPRTGDSVEFQNGVAADITFDNDAHTLCSLSQVTVYAADVKITIPASDAPFVNSLGVLYLYNSEVDKIGRLEVVAPTDADASRYGGYAGCHVGDKNSPACCNNFLILHNMSSTAAGFGLGQNWSGYTNNWITLKNSNVVIGSRPYVRGENSGFIIDDEGFGSSFANPNADVADGAAVIAKPGSHLATGNPSFCLANNYAATKSGFFYATNAIMESKSWKFQGVSSTALVHRCTGSIFSNAANGGENSYLEVSESVQPRGIGDAPSIGGTGKIRISDTFVTNTSIQVTAKDVYATNTVMSAISDGNANKGWRIVNTSASYESVYVADGGGVIEANDNGYGGVGCTGGSAFCRNNTLRLKNGAYSCFPNVRIGARGSSDMGYYNVLYPDSDSTNNWLIVESGSQFGRSIDSSKKANGYANIAIGYTKNGLVVTDPGSAAWIQDLNPNHSAYFTAGTNCTIRVANGATLKAGVLKLRGARFEFAGDSRGETAFVANTAVTFSDGAKLQFEPETAKGWEPVPFAKIVSTEASANTVKILAGPSFRRGGASHLTLATYDENADVAFTLDPESEPTNIELHCDATELWAKIPSKGFTVIVR